MATMEKISGYKIIKVCLGCKKKMRVPKGASQQNYCEDCQAKMQKYREEQAAKEGNKEE